MVLTRAQRAQTKATPPESPLKSSVLNKAPARRGRAKKTESEEDTAKAPPKTTKVTKTTNTVKSTAGVKNEELKSSSSRTTSARSATGTTRASAAKAASSVPKTAAPKGTIVCTAGTKASAARAASTKVAASQKTAPDAKTSKNVKTAKNAKAMKSTARIVEALDEQSEAAVEHTEDEPNTVPSDVAGEQAGQPRKELALTEELPKEDKENAAMVPTSPTKLPRPVTTTEQPVSPFKMSLLSSVQGLGSVRKPPVPNALFKSPAKPVMASQLSVKGNAINVSPERLNTSVRDFAAVLGSPRRPGSSGSDQSVTSRASTPKRAHTEENTAQLSAKRLRTSISMPLLGSPQRSQSSTAGSPPSPTKSSLRSPVKRPNMSPKKVSWHQTPPRQLAVQEKTPPSQGPGILDGCVFFLDINSLNGANVNNLFAGLIEELGGKYVQEWTHNNMGITHVLFMNGEMRTLEKVLASNGEVYCVSLGWLLDCQREKLRIPESQPRYLVDLTHVPGHTPKPNRSALNTPMTARSTAPVSHTPALPPPKWALPTTPSAPREPLGALNSSLFIKTPAFLASKTPGPPPSVGVGTIDQHDKENVSPVSEATPLMQKTCPPKQFNKSILAISTGISATPLRNKLLASKQRRRSFDGVGKLGAITEGGLHSPPRKPLGLGSPRRQVSPLKRSLFRP